MTKKLAEFLCLRDNLIASLNEIRSLTENYLDSFRSPTGTKEAWDSFETALQKKARQASSAYLNLQSFLDNESDIPDYKQIAINYIKGRLGARTYYWEEWDDPEDDTTANAIYSEAPKSDSSDYSWREASKIQLEKAEILGLDKDEPELTVVLLEAEITISSGKSWWDDDGHHAKEETEEPYLEEICVWINEAGEVCACEEYDDGVEICPT